MDSKPQNVNGLKKGIRQIHAGQGLVLNMVIQVLTSAFIAGSCRNMLAGGYSPFLILFPWHLLLVHTRARIPAWRNSCSPPAQWLECHNLGEFLQLHLGGRAPHHFRREGMSNQSHPCPILTAPASDVTSGASFADLTPFPHHQASCC